MPTSYMERSMGQFADIAGELGKVIRAKKEKERKDAIARELAARYPELQGIDDMSELETALKLEDAMTERKYKRALATRAEREPVGSAAATRYIDTPEGVMTAAEWARIKDARAKEENRLAPGSPGPAGMIWTGQSFQEAPEEYTKQQTKAQQLEAEIARLEAAAAAGNEYLGPEKLQIGTPSSAQAKAKRAELDAIRRALQPSAAASIYKSRTGGDVEPNADALTQQVKPKVSSGDSAEAVAADFKAKRISREEAQRRLKALGFDD